MFDWMAWTLPVAVFFSCIVLMLAGMTVWELKSPTVLRKGFLPIATTRGDRMFIGRRRCAAAIHPHDERHDARRSPVHRSALGRLPEPGLRRREREDDRLVRPRAGAVDLDQFRRLDGAARADHEKGLTSP